MATTTANPDARTAQPAVNPAAVYAGIAALAQFLNPGETVEAIELCIVVNGHRSTIRIATGSPSEPKPVKLRPTQRKILDVLKGNVKPMPRLAVALKLGRDDAKGTFGKYIRDLLGKEIIFSNGDEITDDVSKFDATS